MSANGPRCGRAHDRLYSDAPLPARLLSSSSGRLGKAGQRLIRGSDRVMSLQSLSLSVTDASVVLDS